MTRKKRTLALMAIGLGLLLLVDSLFALITGDFLLKPHLWSDMLKEAGIDPFEFAPGILALGCLWLISAGTIITRHKWWRGFYGTTAMLSLWYLPIGTLVSLISLVVILSGLLPRKKQRTFIIVLGAILSIIITILLSRMINGQGAS